MSIVLLIEQCMSLLIKLSRLIKQAGYELSSRRCRTLPVCCMLMMCCTLQTSRVKTNNVQQVATTCCIDYTSAEKLHGV